MSKVLERAFEVALILGVVWLLSSCGNTTHGFGSLVRGVGTDIQIAAENSTVQD